MFADLYLLHWDEGRVGVIEVGELGGHEWMSASPILWRTESFDFSLGFSGVGYSARPQWGLFLEVALFSMWRHHAFPLFAGELCYDW